VRVRHPLDLELHEWIESARCTGTAAAD